MSEVKTYRNRGVEYQDMFLRLYPELTPPPAFHPDGTQKTSLATRNVTFVVTEQCNLRCSYCNPAGTQITLADFSTKNIEDVVAGDRVLGFEEYTQSVGAQRKVLPTTVTEVFKRVSNTLKITLENGIELIVTPEHPILVRGNNAEVDSDSYCEAGRLTIGQAARILPENIIHSAISSKCYDNLYFKELMASAQITSIEELNGEVPVYNFETDCHTYFANNVAVHNCYQHNKNSTRMTEERAREFVDILFEEDARDNRFINPVNAQALIIEFIGGEPLLEIDLIDSTMRYFRWKALQLNHRWALHHIISISTNGILYNTPKVQDFVKRNLGRLSLTITIDGNKALHDSCRLFPDGSPSYDIVEASVREHLKINPFAATKLTLAPANIVHTYSAVRHLFEEIGLPDVYANCVYEEGWTYEHAKVFYEQLKQLADWMLGNDIEQKYYCSLFEESIGKPLDPSENNNWCFRAGTLISTPAGSKPIEELKIGDEVLSSDGSMETITNVMSRNADADDVITVKATGAFPLHTTKEHPFYAKRFLYKGNRGVYRYSEPEWIPAGNLVRRAKLAFYQHTFGTKCVDENLAYIVGRYIGDGWDSTTGYKLCSSYAESEALSEKLNSANIIFSTGDYKTVKQFNLFKKNTELLAIISDAGHMAVNKRIPKEVFTWRQESVEALLTGLFDADGYEHKKAGSTKIKFNTASPTLANDVMILLRACGYLPTCYIAKRAGLQKIEGRTVNVRDRYEVYFNKDKSEGRIKSRYYQHDSKTGTLWTGLYSVDKNTPPYEVFNLTVSGSHTFIANGLIVHNCGGSGSMLSFTPNGFMQPCLRYTHFNLNDKQPEIRVGDVETGIANRAEYIATLDQLDTITRRSQSTDECFNCPIASGCSWCSAYNYEVTGSPNKRVTFICPMHKARVLANHYYWCKIYDKYGVSRKRELTIPDEWALNIVGQEELDMLKSLNR